MWSRDRLASLADVSMTSLIKFERETGTLEPSKLAHLRVVFEEAGIEFLPEDSGPRVILMKAEGAD